MLFEQTWHQVSMFNPRARFGHFLSTLVCSPLLRSRAVESSCNRINLFPLLPAQTDINPLSRGVSSGARASRTLIWHRAHMSCTHLGLEARSCFPPHTKKEKQKDLAVECLAEEQTRPKDWTNQCKNFSAITHRLNNVMVVCSCLYPSHTLQVKDKQQRQTCRFTSVKIRPIISSSPRLP